MTNWKQTVDHKFKNGDFTKTWENPRNGKEILLEKYVNQIKFVKKNPKLGHPLPKKNYRVMMCLFDNCTEKWFDDYKPAAKFVSDYKKQNNRADPKYLQSKKELAEWLKK